MQRERRQAWIATGLVVAGVVPWLFPSDVPRLIVMERDVLLGRYSVAWFGALFFLITPGCWAGAWVAWSLRTRTHRQVAFRLVALTASGLLGLVLVDVAARMVRKPTYVRTDGEPLTEFPEDHQWGPVLHRLPDQRYAVRYRDEPTAARSYPGRPAGHPPVSITLTTDARGFRNREALEACDVVAVGDSFVEGCLVSDEHAWPVHVAELTGRPLYNLGMSGADPAGYRSALASIGMRLAPRVVVVMICEENDFAGVVTPPTAGGGLLLRVEGLARSSPVYHGLRSALTSLLGPVGADAHVPGFELIGSWLPAHIPEGGAGHSYAFKPKRLLQLRLGRAEFEASYGWTSTAEVLRGIKALCAGHGARLVLTIAPNKARVMMALLRERVSAEQLHAFASMRRRALPAPEVLRREILEHMDARENTLRDFCRSEQIPFVSTTPALIRATAEGRQVLYSYDQHWTPAGHRLVAETLAPAISEALRDPAPAARGPAPR